MQTLLLVLEHDLVLGRDCEGLLLADAQVSRRHLRLRPVNTGVEIADLDSTNGSYLNGVPVTEPQLVERDCEVLIGDTVVSLMFTDLGSTALSESSGAAPFGTATTVRPVDDLRSTSIDLLAEAVSSQTLPVAADSLADTTMTIVFSDIESSTERATEMGDTAWFELLEEHNRIIRSETSAYGGREVKSIGDGFMLVFPSVSRALRFVTAVQRRVEDPAGPDLRVRMGLHTGEAIVDASGDLFGRHINLAARVANLADGGQILASLVVREIAEGRDDAVFGEPAEVELKGFVDRQTVFEVDWRSTVPTL